jgi:hypothetical protein
VRNEEVQWLPAAKRAQRLLCRFIDRAEIISLELFKHDILIKTMPIGRLNTYIQQ